MPISNLTGSETERFEEIRDGWAVFSPSTTDKFMHYSLYGVPNGQTFASEMLIDTGSVTFVSGVITVVKDIHLFNNDTEASKFVNEIGVANKASVSERERPVSIGGVYRLEKTTEIQLVSIPEFTIGFDLLNGEVKRGFKVEVFRSGSDGLREMQRNPEFGADGGLISDTFLKYFEIEEDI